MKPSNSLTRASTNIAFGYHAFEEFGQPDQHGRGRMDCTLFVKNGPSVAGLGLGGEGYLNYSIATTTGEGIVNTLTFTRKRRCVMVDQLNIIG